nr:hypothetical protein MACL_00001719 [Theileria orientalis]
MNGITTAECSALLRITTGRFLSRPERQPGKFKHLVPSLT